MTSTSNSSLTLSKRSFLKGSLATGLGFAGLPLFGRGAAAQAASKGVVSGCHWGVFYGIVEDGRAVEFKPWEGDPR
ncbi:hypothetical protein LZ189_07790, partial [Rhodovulum sulfidophilum]|nr:hypothetical protein [Rhodovulum sulfidophilum]